MEQPRSHELTPYGDNPDARGYLALPAGGAGPGVLVLHAWWGLNDMIKAFCERLAGAGFVVFAPDLYHGKVAATIADAEIYGGEVDSNHVHAEAEVAQAARWLAERANQASQGLGVVGFSLGGYYALRVADAEPDLIDAVVLFYGTDGGYGGEYRDARAAYLGHFAENDIYDPPSNADTLKNTLERAGRHVTFHSYPGAGHWFFEPDREEAYDAAAANLAWERTLAFLTRGLGIGG
jgi:carboxymethylenebutenolidase